MMLSDIFLCTFYTSASLRIQPLAFSALRTTFLRRRDETDMCVVEQHHKNYARILALRQASESLDQQIKDTVHSLASARKQLLDARPRTSSFALTTESSATSNANDGTLTELPRDVKVADVLAYAKFISKTTVPPTQRTQVVPQPVDVPGLGTIDGKETGTNGIKNELQDAATTAIDTRRPQSRVSFEPASSDINVTGNDARNAASAIDSQNNSTTSTNANADINDQRKAPQSDLKGEAKSLLDAATQQHDQASQSHFVPWPTQDMINCGALARIQALVEQGRDPASYVPDDSANGADIAGSVSGVANTGPHGVVGVGTDLGTGSAHRNLIGGVGEDAQLEEQAQQRRVEDVARRQRETMQLGNGARTQQEDVFDPDEM